MTAMDETMLSSPGSELAGEGGPDEDPDAVESLYVVFDRFTSDKDEVFLGPRGSIAARAVVAARTKKRPSLVGRPMTITAMVATAARKSE